MAMIDIFVHSDPGHSWYEVPREVLKDIEVLSLITSYSYQRGSKVYLEEDADATTFFRAAEDWDLNLNLVYREQEEESKVRSYKRFSP